MMRLLLLRHAKSQQDETLRDRDRPLNSRGRSDAPRMGGYMHHKRYLPQLVLCSPAKRTLETWELVSPELDRVPDVRFSDALYLAPAATIEKMVHAVPPDIRTLLLIGHNPGLEDFARALTRAPETPKEIERGNDMRDKFPTCALAVLEFEADSWSGIARQAGALADFARPKTLEDN
ncbi:MAG: histidine phosphatase family protein [Rhizomicrobium sp.]|jgi:phosphohistidine phosphatase